MSKQMKTERHSAGHESSRKERTLRTLGMLIGIALIGGGIWAAFTFRPGWLGIWASESGADVQTVRIVPNTKTLWDLMELFVVPASLLIFGYLLNRRQDERTEREARRRLEIDREIAAEHAEDAALQTYFDAIGDLLVTRSGIDEKAKAPEDVNNDEKVWELARIRTLTILIRLNGERKGYVLRFLMELGLLGGRG